jgi:hypothetical protein
MKFSAVIAIAVTAMVASLSIIDAEPGMDCRGMSDMVISINTLIIIHYSIAY